MRFLSSILLAVVLLACEGPEGPTGPQGPAGPPGPPAEGILIEQRLSASAYDEDGDIVIRDSRITPKTFRALYLAVGFGDQQAYIPLDYLLVYGVSLTPEELEFETPVVAVGEGVMVITDAERVLFGEDLDAFRERGWL